MLKRQLQNVNAFLLWGLIPILMFTSGCGEKKEKAKSPCELTILNTGKSDCLILEMDGKTIVNDTADQDDYRLIMRTLENKGISKIDYMIISHFDKDHIGSAPELIRNMEVGCVIMPDFWGDSHLYQDMIAAIQETNTEQMLLDETYEFSTGEGSISINAPELSSYDDENNYSLITSVSYGEAYFLFMGDALKQRTEEFVNAMPVGQTYDLVKTPHHGDYNKKLKPIFANADASSVAVITAASDDTIETKLMTLLSDNQVETYITYNGTVTVDTDGHDITVTQD